jgi:hypothetical protein
MNWKWLVIGVAGGLVASEAMRDAHSQTRPAAVCEVVTAISKPAQKGAEELTAWMNGHGAAGRTNFLAPSGFVWCAW